MPEVSVIIPSYNHAPYIAFSIESVLKQTFQDFELIVVDDGSQDESLSIINRYSDPRLSVISQSNQGAHSAINHGIKLARGDYLAILNSDDEYHPHRLEKILSALKENRRVGLAGSYIELIDVNNNPIGQKHAYHNSEPWSLEAPERSFRSGDNLVEILLTENYWATSSNFVFTRQAYNEIGEFLPLRYAHDWDFALRLSRVYQLHLIHEPLVRYRIHPRNTIREDLAAMIFEICWILAVHLPSYMQDGQTSNKPLEKRIDQLLHSIYTYDCDRVLNVMLLQNLSEDKPTALRLLNLSNPDRSQYIDYIHHNLLKQEALHALPPETMYRTIRRYLRPVKAFFLKFKHPSK